MKRASARYFKPQVVQSDHIGELQNIPHPPMLVDGLIPRGAIVMVTAPTHSGKTFFAAELARALALKVPFAGHFSVPREESTLFIEQDAPKLDVGRVIWAMIRKDWQVVEQYEDQPLEAIRFLWHHGLDLYKGEDCAKVIGTANAQFFSHGFHSEVEPVYDEAGDIIGTKETNDEVGRRGVGLIVYDSLRSLHTAEENDSGEMEAIMQDLKYIRAQTGATQLILHHENADGSRPRGSTAIDGAVDITFRLSRKGNSTIVTARAVKGRIIQPASFRYQIISTEEEGKITKQVRFVDVVESTPGPEDDQPKADELGQAFSSYLKSRGPVTRETALEWAALNGTSRATFDRMVARLKQVGLRSQDGAYFFA